MGAGGVKNESEVGSRETGLLRGGFPRYRLARSGRFTGGTSNRAGAGRQRNRESPVFLREERRGFVGAAPPIDRVYAGVGRRAPATPRTPQTRQP